MIFFKFIECISIIISITEKILLNDYLLLVKAKKLESEEQKIKTQVPH